MKYWSKNLTLLFVANFVVVAVYFLLMTTMVVYALQTYQCSSSTAGFAASVFLIGGVLGRFVTARASLYYTNRSLGILSLALMAVACTLYFIEFLGVGFLILVRLIHGLAFGIANTVLPAMGLQNIPDEHLGEGAGVFMLSQSLGLALGPLVGIFVTMGAPFSAVFLTCTITTIIALLSVLFVSKYEIKNKPNISPKISISSFIEPASWRFSCLMLFIACALSGFNTFLNSWAIELNQALFAPFALLAYALLQIASRPMAGKLLDQKGPNAVIYPATLCMFAATGLCAIALNGWMLIGAGVFMAFGFGVLMSAGQVVATRIAGKENATLAIGTFLLMCDAGAGVGPYFLGIIVSNFGFRWMFTLCSCLSMLGFIYYRFSCGKQNRNQSSR